MSWTPDQKKWSPDTPKENIQSYRSRAERVDRQYNEWLAMCDQVPKSYPTLTEEQWLRACAHFGRCAICDTDDISCRGYFIPFNVGGRYCDFNIIPVCEKCATTRFYQNNPFRRLNPAMNRNLSTGRGMGHKKLAAIEEWLRPILEKATKYVGSEESSL